uniref:Uncharacterized protein n=1 Tax=Meloidogyne incognita TaxID=6306 RepID=A0A914KVX5_MELIC
MIFLTTTDAVGNRLLFNWLKPQKSKTRGIEIDNNDQVDINKNKETFHISQSKAEISKPIDEHVSGDLIGEIRSVQMEWNHHGMSPEHNRLCLLRPEVVRDLTNVDEHNNNTLSKVEMNNEGEGNGTDEGDQ